MTKEQLKSANYLLEQISHYNDIEKEFKKKDGVKNISLATKYKNLITFDIKLCNDTVKGEADMFVEAVGRFITQRKAELEKKFEEL